MMRAWIAALGLAVSVSASAQTEDGEPTSEDIVGNESDGYSPPQAVEAQPLRLTGYVDVGFAWASGNGSSFAPNDLRVPADYGVDAFAPAVNSRGEVASVDAGGRFTNGFLPRAVGIGNRPSFLINTASVDVRYAPTQLPVMVFMRLQVMPRFSASGNATRVDLQQAFGRWMPWKSQEFALSVGKFDSVFGIEYLDNEANIRTGITPSLFARYTTGHGVGVKAFYRVQLPALWSAVSLNASATNQGSRIEALVPPDVSLVGIPSGAGRLGYELNLPALQVKLGVSGLYGIRNDQRSRNAPQYQYGADARATAFGVSLSGEILRVVDAASTSPVKLTG